MVKHAVEANFDGLVGPTHNYAGLSWGNVASKSNVNAVANPREAALQGLAKMKRLADRGYGQGILPPHERPHIPTLRALGFEGNERQILEAVAKADPSILAAVSSASCMWTANAATVSPSADTADHRVHFTPANLSAKFHRSIEHQVTGRSLKAIFGDESYFAHHPALPSVSHFGDEGAANHTRLCSRYGEPGVELFVYGQVAFNESAPAPGKYPARQTLEASRAIARLHGLTDRHAVFAQQNPAAIDAGVFHNDVIAVGNGNCLFYHEQAFLEEARVLADIQERLIGAELEAVRVSSAQVPIEDAVASYLFNSQLLNTADGMLLAVPGECREVASVSRYLDELVKADTPITAVEVFDVKQSMRNGGGPACLRLRVVMTDAELAACHQGVLLTEERIDALQTVVRKYYRDRLAPDDLADSSFADECRIAREALLDVLELEELA